MTERRALVVLSDPSIHPEAVALLRRYFDVDILDAYPTEERFANAAAQASAILARLGVVTRHVIETAPRLRIISRHGVGVDAVDIEAATERGIVVTNTGAANAAAVAEYTFALLLALARKTAQADNSMRAGLWQRDTLVGAELDGRVIGIFGLGAIGSRVARQALGFGMRVLACDPRVSKPFSTDITMVNREDLLGRADIVTLHARLTDTTNRMIDAQALAMMKPGALLVNTARGELIDEQAMIEALEAGRLGGAALDTYVQEPLPESAALRRMPNVVLSPHVAGQTVEAVTRVGLAAARAIIEELAGRRPDNVHNPEAYERRKQREGGPVPSL
jgi:D-3-phosphoglycerate dehydrogenase